MPTLTERITTATAALETGVTNLLAGVERAETAADEAQAGAGVWIPKDSNFTAVKSARYSVTDDVTVTDPTSPAAADGDSYAVQILDGSATIGGVVYDTVGLEISRSYIGGWITKAKAVSGLTDPDSQAILQHYLPSHTASPGTADIGVASIAIKRLFRFFNIVEPGFVDWEDKFEIKRGGYTANTIVTAAGIGSISAAGIIRVQTCAAPRFAWWGAEVKVVARPVTSGVVGVGITRDGDAGNDYVLAYYDGTNLGCIRRRGVGDAAQTLFTVALSLTAPYKLAVAQTENCIAAWYDIGAGWQLAGSALVTGGVDYTAVDMTQYRYTLYKGGTGTASYDDFKCGVFGTTGLSSPYIVSLDDGSPMIEARRAYVMFACGGLNTMVSVDSDSASTYRTTHNAVYSWSMDTDELICTSKVFTTRTVSAVVHIWGDCFGPCVFDRESAVFHFFPQNTGNFVSVNNAALLHCQSKADIRHGIHVLDANTLLPVSAQGISPNWDLANPFKDANGLWNWFYSRTSNARPTLDRSTLFTSGFTQIATDNSRINEGARHLNYFGTNHFLTGGPYTYPYYDEDGAYVGTLSIPSTAPTYGTAPSSHPMFVPIPQQDGGTKYKGLTFTAVNPVGFAYTAGTISAASGDNSINDSANAFPILRAGDTITISGFTGTAGNNRTGAVVVSSTASKIVISGGAALVTDAAGESVTVSSGWRGAYGDVVVMELSVTGSTSPFDLPIIKH